MKHKCRLCGKLKECSRLGDRWHCRLCSKDVKAMLLPKVLVLLSMFTLSALACLAPVATIKQDTKSADMTAKISHLTQGPRQMVVCRTDPAHGLNLRTDAGTQFESLGVYPNDTVVTLTGAKKTPVVVDWYQVEIGGVTGWMFSSNLCEVQ